VELYESATIPNVEEKYEKDDKLGESAELEPLKTASDDDLEEWVIVGDENKVEATDSEPLDIDHEKAIKLEDNPNTREIVSIPSTEEKEEDFEISVERDKHENAEEVPDATKTVISREDMDHVESIKQETPTSPIKDFNAGKYTSAKEAESIDTIPVPNKIARNFSGQFEMKPISNRLNRSFSGNLPKVRRHDGVKESPISENGVIIIDMGSRYIKAGVAGENIPRCVFPNCFCVIDEKTTLYGFDALNQEKLNKVVFPLNSKKKIDWDGLKLIFEYLFRKELKIDPSEHKFLITELPLQEKDDKKTLAMMLFDEFEIEAISIQNSAVLSLFALGKLTGLVVEIGNRMQIVPVVFGYVLESYIIKQSKNVSDLTGLLARLMNERGYYFSTTKQLENVRILKENLCYVAENFEEEMEKDEEEIEKSYDIPDGTSVTLGNQRFRCPEALFQPQAFLGLDYIGIHEMIMKCIKQCPVQDRKELLANIVLSGGSTLFPGLEERLTKEIYDLLIESRININMSSIKVQAPKNRKYLAWIGASMMGSMAQFQNDVKYREDFEEEDIIEDEDDMNDYEEENEDDDN